MWYSSGRLRQRLNPGKYRGKNWNNTVSPPPPTPRYKHVSVDSVRCYQVALPPPPHRRRYLYKETRKNELTSCHVTQPDPGYSTLRDRAKVTSAGDLQYLNNTQVVPEVPPPPAPPTPSSSFPRGWCIIL